MDAEIAFIDAMAAERRVVAIGECGLDKFYLSDDISMAEQERVLRKLMQVRTVPCLGRLSVHLLPMYICPSLYLTSIPLSFTGGQEA